jgi:hydrogenase 3 maturation protease
MDTDEHRSKNKKILILGVGNRLRGDDAIGCLITDELKSINGLIVIDCGSAPENFIDKVCSLAPNEIIIVDACNFCAEPGKFQLFAERQIEKISSQLLSTHTLPLSLTVAMIKKQLPCKIQLLGIQPESINFGEGLSLRLEAAKSQIVKYLKDLVKNNEKTNDQVFIKVEKES